MAHDVLSIPVSTITSKSTFSVGRWVIDQFRSALKPDVEALVCSRDWLYADIDNIFFIYMLAVWVLSFIFYRCYYLANVLEITSALPIIN